MIRGSRAQGVLKRAVRNAGAHQVRVAPRAMLMTGTVAVRQSAAVHAVRSAGAVRALAAQSVGVDRARVLLNGAMTPGALGARLRIVILQARVTVTPPPTRNTI